jgi:hypothetical protein
LSLPPVCRFGVKLSKCAIGQTFLLTDQLLVTFILHTCHLSGRQSVFKQILQFDFFIPLVVLALLFNGPSETSCAFHFCSSANYPCRLKLLFEKIRNHTVRVYF